MIAVTSSDDKAARLRQLGADAVVNRNSTPDWSLAVRELTGGRGVDHVVETGGLDTFPHSIACTAEEGSIDLVAAPGISTIDVQAFRNPVTIRRIYVGSRTSFENMNRAIGVHALRPVIDRAFAFADAKEAFGYFQARAHSGRSSSPESAAANLPSPAMSAMFHAKGQSMSRDTATLSVDAPTGQAMVMAPLYARVLGNVPTSHAGSGAGVLSTVQQIGNAAGVAVIGAIYFGVGQSVGSRPAVVFSLALLAAAFATLTALLREPGRSAE